jgi:hypothetical protein
MFDAVFAYLDTAFAVIMAAALVIVRFARIRALRSARQGLDELRAAHMRFCAAPSTLVALLDLARRLSVVRRASELTGHSTQRSVAVRLRGRNGRLAVMDNIFLRSAPIQAEVARELEALTASCDLALTQSSSGYGSPYNFFNLTSSLLAYLGVSLSTRGAIGVDAAGLALLAGVIAAVVWNG